MKFILLVEGETEDKALPEFLRRWLNARLSPPVGVQCVRFRGWSALVKEAALKTRLQLHGVKRDVIAVIGLLDLYGPAFYPPDKRTVSERYGWAKTEMENRVGEPRFRQHFAVHEVEAWLLGDPSVLPGEVAKALPGRAALHPEEVNSHEPPKALLKRLYPAKLKREYLATVEGKKLFSQLDPEIAYDKCPSLRAMLDEMLTLAKAYQS